MKKITLSLFLITAILLIPAVSFAQSALPAGYVETMSGGQYTSTSDGRVVPTSVPSGFGACRTLVQNGVGGVVGCIIGFFDAAVYLIIAASIVYIIWGAFTMIRSEDKREDAKKTIYYGVIGLFVMVSVWGLVHILDNTFQLSGQGPIAPTKLIR
jgi:hypothetical protein